MEKTFKVNKIILICIVLMSLFMCVGCADIEYRRIYSKNGSTVDEVYITLSKDVFSSGQAESLYGTVKSDVDTFYSAVNMWIKDQFGGKYIEDVSVEDFIRQGIEVGTTPIKTSQEGYTFSFYLVFGSIEHYVYFYGLNTPEVIEQFGLDNFDGVKGFNMSDYGPFVADFVQGEYTIDETKLFTKDVVYNSNNVLDSFSVMIKQDNMTYIDYYCSRINALTNNAYTEAELLDNVNIVQKFETDDHRYSTNSSKSYIDAYGYVIHEWNLNDNPDQEISITRARPVVIWWYVLGIVIAFISVVVMFIIAKKRKNINKEVKDGQ